ncbi:MAG: hypothetical protein ACYDCM_03810 [Candidatus Acidiferrales bacterium]
MKRVLLIFASAWLAFAGSSLACPTAFQQSAPPATQAQSQNTSMPPVEKFLRFGRRARWQTPLYHSDGRILAIYLK